MAKRSQHGLSDVLFGNSRGQILALLFGNPGQQFYTRQIASLTGISLGAVSPQLELLTETGLLHCARVGKQVFYQVNRQSPIFGDMKGLVEKTVGIYAQLRSALTPISLRIRAAFVYGSMARGEESTESDVDLMVIGDVRLDEVIECLSLPEKQIGRPINPTLFSAAEVRAKVNSGNHFLSSVLAGKKVFIFGGDDELGALREERVAPEAADEPR